MLAGEIGEIVGRGPILMSGYHNRPDLTEKAIRLAFQANAVKVGPNQFGNVYRVYKQALKTLDNA